MKRLTSTLLAGLAASAMATGSIIASPGSVFGDPAVQFEALIVRLVLDGFGLRSVPYETTNVRPQDADDALGETGMAARVVDMFPAEQARLYVAIEDVPAIVDSIMDQIARESGTAVVPIEGAWEGTHAEPASAEGPTVLSRSFVLAWPLIGESFAVAFDFRDVERDDGPPYVRLSTLVRPCSDPFVDCPR